jgi:hypothetical protein
VNDRLDHLRGLLERLERMPASANRDWMLAQVRGRAVDVETSTAPAPMRPLPHDELEATKVAEPPRVRADRTRAGRRVRAVSPLVARVTPGPARERRHEDVMDLLEHGGVMSLEDAQAHPRRAWSGGLRG